MLTPQSQQALVDKVRENFPSHGEGIRLDALRFVNTPAGGTQIQTYHAGTFHAICKTYGAQDLKTVPGHWGWGTNLATEIDFESPGLWPQFGGPDKIAIELLGNVAADDLEARHGRGYVVDGKAYDVRHPGWPQFPTPPTRDDYTGRLSHNS